MKKTEQIKIAIIAIEKNISYDDLYYSDYMYGNEIFTDDVWKLVLECKDIGLLKFKTHYKEYLDEC